MALDPGICAYCAERRSCVCIGLNGKPAHRIFVRNKKDPDHPIEKWDRECRFLCFYCIKEQVADVKFKILKVHNTNFFYLKPPKGCSTLIFKGDTFLMQPTYWDKDQFAWKMTMEKGDYICLFLPGHKVRHRKVNVDKGINMFPDKSVDQMQEFIKNQGHAK
jgi:hypothetical protein